MNDPTQDAWILDAIVEDAIRVGVRCQLQIEAHTGRPSVFCIVTRNGNTINGFWPGESAPLKTALSEDAEIAAILGFSHGKYITRLCPTTRRNALSMAAIRELIGGIHHEALIRIASSAANDSPKTAVRTRSLERERQAVSASSTNSSNERAMTS